MPSRSVDLHFENTTHQRTASCAPVMLNLYPFCSSTYYTHSSLKYRVGLSYASGSGAHTVAPEDSGV